jgi:hypothetical protein
MTELIARAIVGEEERHLVLAQEVYSDSGEPWTLFVNANHYSASRRTVEKSYYWDLSTAQEDCRERFGVRTSEWVSGDGFRFAEIFRFDYSITNQGLPQPYPLGFEGAEVVFALDKAERPDGSSTSVLNVSGNPDGLRRLAALLILCAESERYDAGFHVHLDHESATPGEPPFLASSLDVTLRAPSYLDVLKDGSFRALDLDVDSTDQPGRR